MLQESLLCLCDFVHMHRGLACGLRREPLAMLQVLSRTDVIGSMTESSTEIPDCRGLGNSAVLGQLPEVLPASLMHHQAFQQLHMQLLPFQVIIVYLRIQAGYFVNWSFVVSCLLTTVQLPGLSPTGVCQVAFEVSNKVC